MSRSIIRTEFKTLNSSGCNDPCPSLCFWDLDYLQQVAQRTWTMPSMLLCKILQIHWEDKQTRISDLSKATILCIKLLCYTYLALFGRHPCSIPYPVPFMRRDCLLSDREKYVLKTPLRIHRPKRTPDQSYVEEITFGMVLRTLSPCTDYTQKLLQKWQGWGGGYRRNAPTHKLPKSAISCSKFGRVCSFHSGLITTSEPQY